MQNIVSKCPKRGLETRIYLLLRNNFVFGRKRKKSHRQNVCKKMKCGFLWNNVYGFIQSAKFESRSCGWFLRTTPWGEGVLWNLLSYVAISSLYQEKRNLSAATASNHASSLLYLLKYYHWERGPKFEGFHIISQLRTATVLQKQGVVERATAVEDFRAQNRWLDW